MMKALRNMIERARSRIAKSPRKSPTKSPVRNRQKKKRTDYFRTCKECHRQKTKEMYKKNEGAFTDFSFKNIDVSRTWKADYIISLPSIEEMKEYLTVAQYDIAGYSDQIISYHYQHRVLSEKMHTVTRSTKMLCIAFPLEGLPRRVVHRPKNDS